MALHAGSAEASGAGTLGAAIERAFVGEVMAVKGTPLPAAGKEDRLILFNAIAQGVLDYLRANETDLRIVLTGLPNSASAELAIRSPTLSASTWVSNQTRYVRVVGDRWPPGTVTLVWADGGAVAGQTSPDGAGLLDATNAVDSSLTSPQRLGARNALGDAVVVELTW